MARHTLRKTELDTELADPTLYSEANKERVKHALFEQAQLAREIGRAHV